MTAQNEPIMDPDFRALAEETLDLWQDYLDSFAADPKARAEMAQMMQPLGQMMAPWSALMQKGMEQASPENMKKVMQATMDNLATATQKMTDAATEQKTEEQTEEKKEEVAGEESKYASSAEIERRMAEFESRIAQLESFLAQVMAPPSA